MLTRIGQPEKKTRKIGAYKLCFSRCLLYFECKNTSAEYRKQSTKCEPREQRDEITTKFLWPRNKSSGSLQAVEMKAKKEVLEEFTRGNKTIISKLRKSTCDRRVSQN